MSHEPYITDKRTNQPEISLSYFPDWNLFQPLILDIFGYLDYELSNKIFNLNLVIEFVPKYAPEMKMIQSDCFMYKHSNSYMLTAFSDMKIYGF